MAVIFEWKDEDFERLVANCPDEPVTPYVFKYFPIGSCLLEAGCGSGRFVYFLDQQGYRITGVEIGSDAVQYMHKMHPDLNIFQGDVTALPFFENSFDGVLSLGVIEHVPQGVEEPLREMYRVLKPDGVALVIVPCWSYIRAVKFYTGIYHLHALLDMLKRSAFLRRLFGMPPLKPGKSVRTKYRREFRRWPVFGEFLEYRFTPQQFEALLQRAGFTIVESIPTSLIDGIYHEFGGVFAPLRNHMFQPNALGRWLNGQLSKVPFLHNHMHLCVVRK